MYRLFLAIARLLGWKDGVPVTDRVVGKGISRQAYMRTLSLVGITALSSRDPLDNRIWVCSGAELDRIVPYLTRSGDDYVAEIADCEDYAMWAAAKAALDYHASTIRLVLGDSDYGYHSYLVMVDLDGHVAVSEPNAAFTHAGRRMEIGEEGYIPRKVLA